MALSVLSACGAAPAKEPESTPVPSSAVREEAQIVPDPSPTLSRDEYVFSDDYAAWRRQYRDAVSASRTERDAMNTYYTRIMPLLLSGEKENAVCSPLNIYLALCMLTETAGGASRQALLETLGVSDLESLRTRARALLAANRLETPVLQSLPAGSLWMRQEYLYKAPAAEALESIYGAELFTGEMGSPSFDQALRDWVNEQTGGLLREYTADMSMDPRTVLELVSTFYYKAAWTTPFSAAKTETQVFHGAQGDALCQMMRRSAAGSYYWGDGFSACSLNLADSGSMVFFLPDPGTELTEIVGSAQVMTLLRQEYSYENSKYLIVNMSVPRFEISGKTDLLPVLSQLGLENLSDPQRADFSSLTEEKGLFLSKADHAAAVSIDEEGVTGAAYTDMAIAASGMPPEETVDFVLDRPFFFAVTGGDGSILFAGTVYNVTE
ncbi:MAG: hypothetical protein IJT62_04035 [Oscillospiraceae bacterium]|nr:hypothetical protein [Oscillospiraceae bacterium]